MIATGARAQSWPDVPGSFLEPNRFAVVGEVGQPHLWLEAGFGRDLVNIEGVNIGLESLFWSRFRNLSGFRFPVETADYFFGIYSTFDLFGSKHRFRASHVSSHYVDGADTLVVGGSSSKFSKEFVSIERHYSSKFLWFNLFGAVGLRYNFHQVTPMESKLQFPSSMSVSLYEFGRARLRPDSLRLAGVLFATISLNAGAFIPAQSYGLTARFAFTDQAALDIFARYYDGKSRAGVEAQTSHDLFEIGVRILPFYWLE